MKKTAAQAATTQAARSACCLSGFADEPGEEFEASLTLAPQGLGSPLVAVALVQEI
jgi:hypothetical protein